MPSTATQSAQYEGDSDLAIAALRHPPLEQALSVACAELAVAEAYLAAVRDPSMGAQPRLLLAVSATGVAAQRRLAGLVANLLPDDLELDLIELAEDSLSVAVRERCTPFYRR
ncbi:enhanced serine sensitivity protein SseB C-terminal domain-containing protein [Pseudomonas sp.]|uniref:enhanced serine sensitivity protein SseB C-terminal domain-containing protein n=1 Tax=Pseudomonas sp. TaxID=306 RepID=UPI003D0E4FB7